MQKTVNATAAKREEVDVYTKADRENPTKEHYTCRVVCQITIPAYSQAAVPVRCSDPGLMQIETHLNVDQR